MDVSACGALNPEGDISRAQLREDLLWMALLVETTRLSFLSLIWKKTSLNFSYESDLCNSVECVSFRIKLSAS